MAVSYPSFNRITFDEANPFLTGAKKGQDLAGEFLKNQIAAAQAKYADPMEQAKLQNQQLENQWNPQLWKSLIDLQKQQANLTGSQVPYNFAHGGEEQYVYHAMTGGQGNDNGQAGNGGQASSDDGSSMPSGAGTGAQTDTPSQVHNLVMNGPSGGNQAQQGSAPTQSAQQPAQQTGDYGLTKPVMSVGDILNNRMTGADSFTPQISNYNAQIQDQFKGYQTESQKANSDYQTATMAAQTLAQYNAAMNKSYFRGHALGEIPSHGIHTATMHLPGHDWSAEQTADRMASKSVPGAMQEVRTAMKTGQFSKADMDVANSLTFDRTMDDETRNQMTQWTNGVQQRMKERAQFLNKMGDPKTGAQLKNADLLWSEYQNQFPLIDKDGKTFLPQNRGKWPLFASPQAIVSIKTNGTYSPPKSARDDTWMVLPASSQHPGQRMMPIKKGRVESAQRKGATPL